MSPLGEFAEMLLRHMGFTLEQFVAWPVPLQERFISKVIDCLEMAKAADAKKNPYQCKKGCGRRFEVSDWRNAHQRECAGPA